jgi:hypothetical protein
MFFDNLFECIETSRTDFHPTKKVKETLTGVDLIFELVVQILDGEKTTIRQWGRLSLVVDIEYEETEIAV